MGVGGEGMRGGGGESEGKRGGGEEEADLESRNLLFGQKRRSALRAPP